MAECRLEQSGPVLVAYLSGEIDHHAAGRLREQIDARILSASPERVVLDFGGVGFMDSSGIGLILGRVRTAALWGGHVTVRGLSPQLKKMAELSGVSALAVLEDTGKGAKT